MLSLISVINICIGAINEMNTRVKKLESDNEFLKKQNKQKTNLLNSIENTQKSLRKYTIDLTNKYNDLTNKYEEIRKV